MYSSRYGTRQYCLRVVFFRINVEAFQCTYLHTYRITLVIVCILKACVIYYYFYYYVIIINLLKIVCVPCIVDENIKIKRENYQFAVLFFTLTSLSLSPLVQQQIYLFQQYFTQTILRRTMMRYFKKVI